MGEVMFDIYMPNVKYAGKRINMNGRSGVGSSYTREVMFNAIGDER